MGPVSYFYTIDATLPWYSPSEICSLYLTPLYSTKKMQHLWYKNISAILFLVLMNISGKTYVFCKLLWHIIEATVQSDCGVIPVPAAQWGMIANVISNHSTILALCDSAGYSLSFMVHMKRNIWKLYRHIMKILLDRYNVFVMVTNSAELTKYAVVMYFQF